MTKVEKHRLHNLFIKFKNEEKNLDEIGGLLKIDEQLLKEWNKAFELAMEDTKQNPEIIKSKILEVDENETYLYDHRMLFQITQLEQAKFKLRDYEMKSVINKEEKAFQDQVKKYLPIFESYFDYLDISFKDNKLDISSKDNKKEVHIQFKLNTTVNEEINKLANEAATFYANLLSSEMSFNASFLIKNPTADHFINAQNILPYSLKTLKVKNFDGIKDTGFDALPIDTNWIFLIGENGYGKTTVLRAISIGFIGDKDKPLFEHDLNINNGIGIEYFSLSRNIINNVGNQQFEFLPHLACYGPSRLQIQSEQTQNDVAKQSTTTYSLFNSNGNLLNIEFELLIWYLEKNPIFDAVKQTFLKLIPYLADIQVDGPQRKVFYFEKEPSENDIKYNPVTFNELASGFRSILAMVGDMMIRLFKSQPDITEPSELAGIVIIDELDLHWHPKMQREIPALLSSIFPKVQFIASTHSLVPLLGAPENSVLLKVNRTVEEGITVEKVEIDFQALSSDTMLRDIFDLEKYQSNVKQKAWERYTKLKGLIHFEKDEAKKIDFIQEREILGDKYNFSI